MRLINKVIISFWSFIILMVFFSSFKEQVFMPKSLQINFATIFPEGWGFFTKNPREPLIEVYRANKNNLSLVTLKNQSVENFFGLSRKIRVVGYESSRIVAQIPQKFWTKDIMSNLGKLPKTKTFDYMDKKLNHIKNGLFLFIIYEPIPFAWSNSNQEENNPIKYIYVNIK
jgi:antimicrobial peptide system SdpA family protein